LPTRPSSGSPKMTDWTAANSARAKRIERV
jgi:hypothetical protein